jgi:hypothetical protein
MKRFRRVYRVSAACASGTPSGMRQAELSAADAAPAHTSSLTAVVPSPCPLQMHQGLMDFGSIAAGTHASYYIASSAGNSSVFSVTPVPARFPSPVHAVFGDFGMANDVCMDALIADAQANAFDIVLHVGDWAYKCVAVSLRRLAGSR